MGSRQMNQMLPASPAKKKMRLTDGRVVEERKPKCVILVVDMGSNCLREPIDEVNFYIYDKEKFKYEAETQTLRDLDLSRENCRDLGPIGSIDHCHYLARYITFGSHLFRIGGQCCSYLQKECLHYLGIRGSRTVDIIDLNSEDEFMVAKKGPDLNCSRIQPHLLILQGSLYVAAGLSHSAYKRIEGMFFMEVLKNSTAEWYWEPVPNPPPYFVESDDVDDLPYKEVIIGAVESIGAIVVGFSHSNWETYSFYTYRPTSSTWDSCTTYTNISLDQSLNLLSLSTPVVSGEFMLWIIAPCPGDNVYLSTLLYVMDLAKDRVITFDLFEENVLPHSSKLTSNYGCTPTLLKLEEGEFCVFWTQWDDPEYLSGPHTYHAVHASTFTLETCEGMLNVNPKEHYISLVPDVKGLEFNGVCIADVPDNKQQRWTTFCSSHESVMS